MILTFLEMSCAFVYVRQMASSNKDFSTLDPAEWEELNSGCIAQWQGVGLVNQRS